MPRPLLDTALPTLPPCLEHQARCSTQVSSLVLATSSCPVQALGSCVRLPAKLPSSPHLPAHYGTSTFREQAWYVERGLILIGDRGREGGSYKHSLLTFGLDWHISSLNSVHIFANPFHLPSPSSVSRIQHSLPVIACQPRILSLLMLRRNKSSLSPFVFEITQLRSELGFLEVSGKFLPLGPVLSLLKRENRNLTH